MGKGWIKLHRSVQDHWLFTEHRVFSRYEAWVDILLKANHDNSKSVIGNSVIKCNRGQSILSLDSWAKRWRWNKSAVRRFFQLLEKDNMIETENVSKTTRITICNYDSYQGVRNDNETNMNRKGNAVETQLTPIKELEKNKKNKKEYTDDFEKFWDMYPVKTSKEKSFEKWSKLNDSDKTKIMETLPAFKKYKPFDDYNHPYPLTYLNQGRWNDELSQVKSTEQKYTPPKQIVIDHSSLN